MEARITIKGQITLPKALRDAMHLKTGDKVLFEPLEDGTYVIKPRATDYLIQQIGEKHGYEMLLTFDQKASKETGFQSAF